MSLLPPPLFIASPISGSSMAPRLRRVNPSAVAYLRAHGASLQEKYPAGAKQLQAMAPPFGSEDATTFVAATGLRAADVYPPDGGKPAVVAQKGKGILWAGTAAGLMAGAMIGWPWPLVGAVGGAAVDWWRGHAALKGSQ